MIRVYMIEDQELVRTGFRMILAGAVDMDCVGEAGTGEEGLADCRKLRPDVVLCDLHLPGISGLEVTKRLTRLIDGPRVVVLSVQEDGPLPRRVLDAGASGYLSKACAADELLRAIREAARGRRYLGADIAQRLAFDALDPNLRSPFDELSPRELEVAHMLCQGMRMTDIAARLHLSPKTVSTHKYRLFDKLAISDTVTLSRMAVQYGVRSS